MKISNKIKMAVFGLAAVATLGASALVAPAANAAPSSVNINSWTSSTDDLRSSTGLMDTLNTIINVALGLIGFVAVVMIIVGGVQYTTSSGDANKVTKAKNTIMYGIVGLVIALLAFAIVNFVLANVFQVQ